MADITQQQVSDALSNYIEPFMEKDLISTKTVKDISIDGDKVSIKIQLGFPSKGYA